MTKLVSVYTEDSFLYQKIKLSLSGDALCVRGKCDTPHLILVDLDTSLEIPEGAVTMSRYGDADLTLPLPLGKIDELLSAKRENEAPLRLNPEKRSALLCGDEIRLTEVEFSLLSAIYKRGGEYAERAELVREVWGDSFDGGVLNVYIHYLREKLEKSGEKIILSSRKLGYKISDKYMGGALCSE